MLSDPQFIGSALYLLVAGMFAFLDFSPSEPGSDDENSVASSRHADLSSLATDGAVAGTDGFGTTDQSFTNMDLASWYDMLHSEDLDLPMLGTDPDYSQIDTQTEATDFDGTGPEVTDFAEGTDVLVIEFPADSDPGELSVSQTDDDISAVVLGGVVVAMVRGERPISLESIVLKGV